MSARIIPVVWSQDAGLVRGPLLDHVARGVENLGYFWEGVFSPRKMFAVTLLRAPHLILFLSSSSQ